MSVNEDLRDAAIGHAIDLRQYSSGVVRRIIALLNRVDADLVSQLREALERAPGGDAVEWLEGALASVRRLNAGAYEAAGLALTEELRALAGYEVGYQYQLLTSTLPAGVVSLIGVAQVTPQVAYAAAVARPFQGVLLREWAQRAGDARMVRIRDAVRMGYVEGQTIDQIVRRIRGTRAARYADGLIEIDRRHAETIVRTAVSHTASVAREKFFEGNSDLIESEQWLATLDTRTSPPCRLRDRRLYAFPDHKPIGHSYPWGSGPGAIHYGCRSVSTVVTKSWRDLGIDMDRIAPSERASMDGAVPGDTTYAAWIERQSAARQEQILGPVRARLMREGGLSLDRFADDRGQWLTLDQLRARDAAAFAHAGL